jgi:imidazolonepropionase-like amidohydrolase
MPEEIRNQWDQYAYSQDYSEDDWKSAPQEFENQLKFISMAKKAGVKITAGTDLANPFIMPGRSLHDELAMLVENCEFSTIDALRASSALGAELLGQADDLGVIEKRKIADLLILDNNPLENIRNTRGIRTVIKDGKVVKTSA